MEGKIEGKTGRDRLRHPIIKQIIEDIRRATYKELKAAAVDRSE